MSTISTTFKYFLQLGTPGDYGITSPLTITSTGSVGGIYGPGGTAWTVVNQGTLIPFPGSFSIGIDLFTGGNITNSGLIEGSNAVEMEAGAGSVTNSGTILGTGTHASGISLDRGGTVTNTGLVEGRYGIQINSGAGMVTNSGTILGTGTASAIGVSLSSDASTLINAGTISGARGTAVVFDGIGNRLVVEPGAVFLGAVRGGSGNDTLELGSSASAGTLSGLGTSITNFTALAFDSGARWLLGGNSAGLTGAMISGFTIGDTIDLTAFAAVDESFAGNALVLTDTLSNTVTIGIEGGFSTGSFVIPLDGSGGTDIEIACFREGTRIATDHGDSPVQSLRIGERVCTMLHGEFAPVVWIGQRRVDCTRHPDPAKVWPVRVARGAFAGNRPRRDLWLSPDHAVLVDGALIPIRYLVNGASIAQIPTSEVAYYHVELARHDALLAEGLAAESYLDTGNRSAFANGGPLVEMHPGFALGIWDTNACAPLVLCGQKLNEARGKLLARLPRLGYAVTEEPELRFLADGHAPIEPQVLGDSMCLALPDGTTKLHILSRHARPGDLDPSNTDFRDLGAALTHLRFDGEALPLEHPNFLTGWHEAEADLRWTNGAAVLDVDGASIVELCFARALIRYAVPRVGRTASNPARQNLRYSHQSQAVGEIELLRRKILMRNEGIIYGYARVSTDAQDLKQSGDPAQDRRVRRSRS